MKKLDMLKTTYKINRKAIIRLVKSNNLKVELTERQKDIFIFIVNIKDITQIDDLIDILKNKKINQVVIENIELIAKDKMEKVECINKFTYSKMKCIELKNGYNNYIEESIINSKLLVNMIFKNNQEPKTQKLEKNKKTLAYMSFKDINDNEESYYIQKSAEEDIKKYAEKNKLKISDCYIDYVPDRLDTKNRGALQKLIHKIQTEDIGQVLIPKMEHISRDMGANIEIVENICKFGTKIVCCNTNLILG